MTRTRFTRATVGTAAVSLLLALTACGGSTSAAPPTTSSGEGPYPKTIEHAMGSTTLDKKPLRVATLDASYTDAALALGAEVAAYTTYRKGDENFPAYLGDVSTLTKNAVNVGALAEPSLDKILEAQPDLIVSAKVRHEALYGQLSKIAPTIFSASTGPTWKQNIVMLGDALGKKDYAQQLITEYQERAKKVGTAILAKKPGLTYSYVRFAGEDTARLYSSSSFLGEIMKDAGIPRPTGQPDSQDKIMVELGQEKITQADAGLIITSAFGQDTGEGAKSRAQMDKFMSNPLWKSLKGQVLKADDRVFATSVSLQGAHGVLTRLAETFGVDPELPAKK
ncbi:iron-siderophore ABC transporter substrate-binding protein [Arthrobacter woluwensis]|uniref:ABC transporter substrate-binding protein n=1 Tax=Arthrobacter woluwensis TaxID=156980 RepID=UPI000D12DC2F|nr:iron-siderophore ABC transporter substrate-binding protein [Arthrobacter woluwensis]PSS43580.1 iron-siderophore ABC transporter substrate-binding protein [Arthrobacter woluwensis]